MISLHDIMKFTWFIGEEKLNAHIEEEHVSYKNDAFLLFSPLHHASLQRILQLITINHIL